MYIDDIYSHYIGYQLVFISISPYLLKHNQIRAETQFEYIYEYVILLISFNKKSGNLFTSHCLSFVS